MPFELRFTPGIGILLEFYVPFEQYKTANLKQNMQNIIHYNSSCDCCFVIHTSIVTFHYLLFTEECAHKTDDSEEMWFSYPPPSCLIPGLVVWAVQTMFCGVEFILPKVHTFIVDSSSRPHQGRCYSHNTTSLIFRIVRPKKWSQSVCIIVRTTFKHFVFALYIIWQFLPWRKIHLLFGTCMLSPISFVLILLLIIWSWVLSIIRLKPA